MDFIKELILHITFILFPIFLYQTILLSRPIKSGPILNKWLVFFLCAISSILCALYPLFLFGRVAIDFQFIPLVTAILYAGPLAGVMVLIVLLFYFFFFAGLDCFIVNLFSLPIFFLLPLFLSKKWNSFKYTTKLLLTFLIGTTKIAVFHIVLLLLGLAGFISLSPSEHNWILISEEWSLFVFGLLIEVYAIEYLIENALYRIRIIKSEKLAIASELAASVAHEVRNPLTVVRGFIQLMGKEAREHNPKNKEYTDLVLSELDRAQEIITDYLNLARQQYFEKEKLNLTELLVEAGKIMTSYANFKAVSLETHIAEDLFTEGDSSRLKQVFLNLVKNAIEAVPAAEGKVTIKAYASHEFIRIKIMDNGVGMTTEQLARLGEPYFTMKEKGTGLGLTVTFSIIEQHQGTIRYQSELSKGTAATVSLPIFRG
ncbi:ATP-binding protein [Metabacillus sp. GX 13764]|uniref:ATP-binding protein n=1 Tax=Metabacillus kandeliae TaxID=2900151 RepID=UPI001E493C05|nr:ATP-binding protein [Metabacillus kandeliae]MCD7035747.1 ATP-binding protein [Metabacillus kandeliae]